MDKSPLRALARVRAYLIHERDSHARHGNDSEALEIKDLLDDLALASSALRAFGNKPQQTPSTL